MSIQNKITVLCISLVVLLGMVVECIWFAADHSISKGQAELVNRQAVAVGKNTAVPQSQSIVSQSIVSQSIVADLSRTRSQLGWSISIAILLGTVIAAVASRIVGRRITVPVLTSIATLEEIAAGDLTKRIKASGNDETGRLARAVNVFVDTLQNTIGSLNSNSTSLNSSSSELAATSNDLASAASDAAAQAVSVASAAERMSTNMGIVSKTTADVSSNVNNVAVAVDQMTASIDEMAKFAQNSAMVSCEAVALLKASDEKVGSLGTAANEVGEVVTVIEDIAQQTNLLALNATIEAARAGASGKGFAVVATEVKLLAKQTSDATEDIRRRIEFIQGSTNDAVSTIRQINDVVNTINEMSRTIASSVEEQSGTTRQMAHTVSETATATLSASERISESAMASEEISRNIVEVEKVLKQTADGASQTREAGKQFSSLADQMDSLVHAFKISDQ